MLIVDGNTYRNVFFLCLLPVYITAQLKIFHRIISRYSPLKTLFSTSPAKTNLTIPGLRVKNDIPPFIISLYRSICLRRRVMRRRCCFRMRDIPVRTVGTKCNRFRWSVERWGFTQNVKLVRGSGINLGGIYIGDVAPKNHQIVRAASVGRIYLSYRKVCEATRRSFSYSVSVVSIQLSF